MMFKGVHPLGIHKFSGSGWSTHRVIIDKLHYFSAFPRRGSDVRVLVLSKEEKIARAQIYPFFYCSDALQQARHVVVRELPLDEFLAGRNPYKRASVDIVCFQTWFDLNNDAMASLVDDIRNAWPGAKLVFLDWFAPTDLRYAEVLNERVDLYVKKQVLSDFSKYGHTTIGDTNLADYYSRQFGLQLPTTRFQVPAAFKDKLYIGPGFEASPEITGLSKERWSLAERPIDLHARIATIGTEWYSVMRCAALDAVSALHGNISVRTKGRVKIKEFFAELRLSKICFSPFGYGEICWRDYEAMATGAVLLKPDVGHLALSADLFRAGETYIPVRWDLSDFEATVRGLLADRTRRETIARNAYQALTESNHTEAVAKRLMPVFDRICG